MMETRWKRKEVSLGSPDSMDMQCPTSLKKSTPAALHGPKDSMAIGTKWRVLVRPEYLATFKRAVDSAAAPAIVLVLARCELAKVSGAVTSHVKHLPLCHGLRVQPSGLLPSSRNSPAGSLFDFIIIIIIMHKHLCL